MPANRAGATVLSVPQLELLQGVIAIIVFVPFGALYLRQPPRLDVVWAGLRLLGAVYSVFRGR